MTIELYNLPYLVAANDALVFPAFHVLCIVTIPLACVFLYYLNFYRRAVVRNLPAHVESPFGLLTYYTYRIITFYYCGFILCGVALFWFYMIDRLGTALQFAYLFLVLSFFVVCSTSSYQLTISAVSFQRFWNSYQLETSHVKWTRKSVRVLVVGIGLLIVVKELVLWGWLLDLMNNYESVVTVFHERMFSLFLVHAGIYLLQQIILITATICEYSISAPVIGHAEHLLSNHTKFIGVVKTIFFLIFTGSWFVYIITSWFEYYHFLAYIAFIGIDVFLVPVIIEVTEVHSKPKIVVQCVQAHVTIQAHVTVQTHELP